MKQVYPRKEQKPYLELIKISKKLDYWNSILYQYFTQLKDMINSSELI
jgi:hypothetical protein